MRMLTVLLDVPVRLTTPALVGGVLPVTARAPAPLLAGLSMLTE